jgi:hypothetical protein
MERCGARSCKLSAAAAVFAACIACSRLNGDAESACGTAHAKKNAK